MPRTRLYCRQGSLSHQAGHGPGVPRKPLTQTQRQAMIPRGLTIQPNMRQAESESESEYESEEEQGSETEQPPRQRRIIDDQPPLLPLIFPQPLQSPPLQAQTQPLIQTQTVSAMTSTSAASSTSTTIVLSMTAFTLLAPSVSSAPSE